MTAVNAAIAIQTNAPAVLALDLFAEFATDAALENGGAWVTYKGATRFLIARAQNENFGALIAKTLQENEAALQGDSAEAKALSAKLMNEVLAKTILLGWENVAFKGKPVDYSVETAAELLTMTDFRVWVREQSANRDNYKLKLEDEAVKN